ncbi:ras-related protein Ral-A isoform X2 [Saimiri boliviensis]|uniref:ras-related protein Ral-A isoform X2 n=1 Tax=Saimiri boliviensis TaxID=27679 RepID=UPI003D77E874
MAASALPSSPRTPSWSPKERQGHRGADAEIREPPRGPRPLPSPGEMTSPRRAQKAGGGAARKRRQPSARRGRRPGSLRPPSHCSPAWAGITLLSARGQEVAPQPPRPAPQRPGSDLRRLLQSRQEEGGSPQSEASESSSSSSSRPSSAVTRQTPPSNAPGAGPPRRQGPSTLLAEPRSRGFRSPRGGGLARSSAGPILLLPPPLQPTQHENDENEDLMMIHFHLMTNSS